MPFKKDKIKKYYQMAAVIFLNTTLLLAFIFTSYVLYEYVKDKFEVSHSNPYLNYDPKISQALYPDMPLGDIYDLLEETWSRPFHYEPLSQFMETPFSGKYVNVTNAGYRKGKDQGPWPPSPENFNVFVFGGSTTFGYGVKDEETLPSRLQSYLKSPSKKPLKVYNFGQGFYYSTQEMLLFRRLLNQHNKPDFVIFVDGMNDFNYMLDEPFFTPTIKKMFEKDIKFEISPVFGLKAAMGRLPAKSEEERQLLSLQELGDSVVKRSQKNIERYLNNRKVIEAIASAYGVRGPVFVIQPVPMHDYNFVQTFTKLAKRAGTPKVSYTLLANSDLVGHLGLNVIWLGNMQHDLNEPLYVDNYHYNAKMNRLLAQKIADEIAQRGLISG